MSTMGSGGGAYKYNPKISVVKRKIASEFKFKYSEPVEPRLKVESDHLCSKGNEYVNINNL